MSRMYISDRVKSELESFGYEVDLCWVMNSIDCLEQDSIAGFTIWQDRHGNPYLSSGGNFEGSFNHIDIEVMSIEVAGKFVSVVRLVD